MSHDARWTIRQLEPFGVELNDQLSLPLSAGDREFLRTLFDRHKLLLFRNQCLDEARHVDLLSTFGTVLGSKGEYREISSDGNLGSGPLAYHSDLAFTDEPFRVISLQAMEVNDGESWTSFANGVEAAKRLAPEIRSKVNELDALTVISVIQSHREVAFNPPAFLPQQRRPTIIRHPRTGEPVLYISEMQTARIEGLAQTESDELLAILFDTLYSEPHVYRHYWNNSDLLIWDNVALQHARGDLTGMYPRRLQRVVCADKSFFDLCPQFDLADPRIAAWASGEQLTVE